MIRGNIIAMIMIFSVLFVFCSYAVGTVGKRVIVAGSTGTNYFDVEIINTLPL